MERTPGLDAASALDHIRRQQARVVEEALVPPWYWWAIAGLTVALCALVDLRAPVLTVLAALAYAALVLILSIPLVFGLGRSVRVSSDMLGDRGAIAIVAFVWTVVGVSLVVGFSLQLGGAGHSALWAGLVAALGLIVGGPRLMGRLQRVMLANTAGRPDA
jgi:hypothetical protein